MEHDAAHDQYKELETAARHFAESSIGAGSNVRKEPGPAGLGSGKEFHSKSGSWHVVDGEALDRLKALLAQSPPLPHELETEQAERLRRIQEDFRRVEQNVALEGRGSVLPTFDYHDRVVERNRGKWYAIDDPAFDDFRARFTREANAPYSGGQLSSDLEETGRVRTSENETAEQAEVVSDELIDAMRQQLTSFAAKVEERVPESSEFEEVVVSFPNPDEELWAAEIRFSVSRPFVSPFFVLDPSIATEEPVLRVYVVAPPTLPERLVRRGVQLSGSGGIDLEVYVGLLIGTKAELVAYLRNPETSRLVAGKIVILAERLEEEVENDLFFS